MTDSRDASELTNDEIKRYSRHLIMPEVGVDGQRRLKAGSVLCIGAGGLGSPAAMYLAAAGVGTHRHRRLRRRRFQQPAAADYSRHAGRRPLEARVGEGSAERASTRTSRSTRTRRRCRRRTRCELFEPYDVILDGTDNFPTRYLVNDACVLLGKPNAYGSIFRFEGQASVFATKDGPCYRCLYPEPPPPGLVPSCAEGGVLGVLPGIIGVIQATEAIKLILGIGEPLIGRFLIYDALRMRFRELKLRKDPDCPVCGTHPTVTKLIDYEQFCGIRPAAPEPTHRGTTSATRNHGRRAEAAARPRRQADDRRRPRAERIPDQPDPRVRADSARRAAAALRRARPGRARSSCSARSGGRSAKAADFLRSVGFKRVLNLKGGILDWIDKVDPSQPKY